MIMDERVSAPAERGRYGALDAIRGAAILSMAGYHLCYDIFCVFGKSFDFAFYPSSVVWVYATCCTFIIISGTSANFTRRGYKRGLFLNLCGLVITAATALFMPEQIIWFGVLNFMGCAVMITFALRKTLCRVDPLIGMTVSLILFAVFFGLPYKYLGLPGLKLVILPDRLYGFAPLAVIGLPPDGFFSADYFPLIPWLFLYFAGYFSWRLIEAKGAQRKLVKKVPILDFIGRHSLLIYLLHQPVLYGICRVFLD